MYRGPRSIFRFILRHPPFLFEETEALKILVGFFDTLFFAKPRPFVSRTSRFGVRYQKDTSRASVVEEEAISRI